MSREFTRIFSDIHFGDRASRVRHLDQLRPLLAGVDHLILNGDTLDTRPTEFPAHTARCRAAVTAFFAQSVGRVTYVTGNHDGDFSPIHHLDLAAGAVFVIHGDILFDAIVPWSRDAGPVRRRIRERLDLLEEADRKNLAHRLAIFRAVAMTIPQRHQSEPRALRYRLRYLADTVWPPHRAFAVLHAWWVMPGRSAALVRRHRPAARFIVTGHSHRPGVWTFPDGITVLNTGSFTLPLGACAVDVTAAQLAVRRIERRQGHYHPGPVLAEFPLAGPHGIPETAA